MNGTPHDGTYKSLFSYPIMVEGLLRDFVKEPWLAELDYSTLERCNGSYVSDDLRQRADDIIWRVKLKESGQWLYLYLLIEFQSEDDPQMALRIMVYTGLLYQDLIKSGVVNLKKNNFPRSSLWLSIMEEGAGRRNAV
ncbi:MAG: Rpn family recombination-promoting nuclease/putative transposase [Gammaproteobacteria bacterium]|nr:Rpn family recombination-promoting nuclease/putative transposase [Gammaproteobacteria bacterium]